MAHTVAILDAKKEFVSLHGYCNNTSLHQWCDKRYSSSLVRASFGTTDQSPLSPWYIHGNAYVLSVSLIRHSSSTLLFSRGCMSVRIDGMFQFRALSCSVYVDRNKFISTQSSPQWDNLKSHRVAH